MIGAVRAAAHIQSSSLSWNCNFVINCKHLLCICHLQLSLCGRMSVRFTHTLCFNKHPLIYLSDCSFCKCWPIL